MRWTSLSALLRKEAHALFAARAFWLLLLLLGLLVGQGFISAVELYAEASRGAPELAAQLHPGPGVFAPAFGAYELAAMLLLPFVGIRLLGVERQNGGLALLLQTPASLAAQIAAKALVLLLGWLLALLPAFVAMGLWASYGGHLPLLELLGLLLGHLLRGAVAIGLSLAAAALADTSSSAAILALAFTLGTWVLDFLAPGRDGIWTRLAALTPGAALRPFDRGLLPLGPLLALPLLAAGLATFAAVLLRPEWRKRRRLLSGTLVGGLTLGACLFAGRTPRVWDLSEGRRNSFDPGTEIALRAFPGPLRIEAFLAPEDPRCMDLQQELWARLRRCLPAVELHLASSSRSGRFEQEGRYGEIWYELEGRRAMSRSTSEEEVLPLLFELVHRPRPVPASAPSSEGHPLVAAPRFSAAAFFILWPLALLAAAWGPCFGRRP